MVRCLRSFGRTTQVLAAAALVAVGVAAGVGRAQNVVIPDHPIVSLTNVAVPEPPNLGDYVRNRQIAIVLGKALFWDMQAGSDGVQACASCHFHAGADNRAKNQLNPNLTNAAGPPLSTMFDATPSGTGGPNYTLRPSDFPFHRLADVTDRESAVLFTTDDVVSSQGVFKTAFGWVTARQPWESCTGQDDIFQVNHVNVRRVEPRNTPTAIGSAFNFRNFWDGRANNVFNGVNPFGPRDPNARIFELQPDGTVVPVIVRLVNSSAASQAVGPPGSPFEMSCGGRGFPDIGRKLLTLRPLAKQKVDGTDSVLGPYIYPGGLGLRYTYAQLIKQAFQPKYWMAAGTYNGYTQMEANFSLFFGLAVQLYEATLVPNQTRFDRFVDGDATALTAQERDGLNIFKGKGKCHDCHVTPEFTSAATHLQFQTEEGALVERMVLQDGSVAIYDSGFYNIGVVPTANDIGNGGTDPFGNPWSYARQAKLMAAGQPVPDHFHVDPNSFFTNPGAFVTPDERDAVDGSFKTPTLRNIELTGPYFHTGGYATLESVIDFYNRGGNRRGPNGNDTTGFGPNPANLHPDIHPLFLSGEEKAALVAFLKALTDERVRWEKAPFDHPQLFVPNGHPVDQYSVANDGTGKALDSLLEIPRVGAAGRAAKGLPPLKNFLAP